MAEKHHPLAEPLLVDCWAGWVALGLQDQPDALSLRGNLGAVYHAQGRYAEAESVLREVWEKKKTVLGDTHPGTLMAQVLCLQIQCRFDYCTCRLLVSVVLFLSLSLPVTVCCLTPPSPLHPTFIPALLTV